MIHAQTVRLIYVVNIVSADMYRYPHGFECNLEKKLYGNRPVVARGEAECFRPVVAKCNFFQRLHSKTCGYLLII